MALKVAVAIESLRVWEGRVAGTGQMERLIDMHWRMMPRLQLAPACLSLLLLTGMEARGAETGVVFSCGSISSDSQAAGLCKALEAQLRSRFSALRIESQARDQASVKGLRIEFLPGKISRNGISGRLRWRAGDQAGWIAGPMIQTIVMDAGLNDVILRDFARNLVATSKF